MKIHKKKIKKCPSTLNRSWTGRTCEKSFYIQGKILLIVDMFLFYYCLYHNTLGAMLVTVLRIKNRRLDLSASGPNYFDDLQVRLAAKLWIGDMHCLLEIIITNQTLINYGLIRNVSFWHSEISRQYIFYNDLIKLFKLIIHTCITITNVMKQLYGCPSTIYTFSNLFKVMNE